MSSYGAIDGYEAVSTQPPRHKADPRSRSKTWIIIAGVTLCVVVVFNHWASSAGSSHQFPNKIVSDDSDADAANFNDENRALFYRDQLVDHFDPSVTATWSNRYYASTEYFKGPGHPIFMIVGGEGSLDHGMLYPFITQHLAPRFGAAVIEIEHRFYGPYQPIVGRKATVDELIRLLTPQQAMADMVRLTSVFKDRINCSSSSRASKEYCPVISVGGSYPGFLSAMFRLVYPNFVDISYAASAPLKLYDQSADPYVYYDIVTKAAERLSPGCAHAVRTTLRDAKKLINLSPSVHDAVKSMNMCVDKVPDYITNVTILGDEVMTAVSFIFADYNMDAYPPGPELGLYKACQLFQEKQPKSPLEKMATFFQLSREQDEAAEGETIADDDTCFDVSILLTDADATSNTTTEWSDVVDGNMWDFQLCTTLIDPIGVSSDSMFPPRKWSYEDLTEYCHREYGQGVTPQPFALVQNLGFDKLDETDASYILFTNGMQDMWSGGSYLEDLSDTILALNFENGAHHSDLSHVGPTENDTDDIREGFVKITDILEKWLDEIKNENN